MGSLKEYYNCPSMNMILELTNACNLRCKYCFEDCQTVQRTSLIMKKEVLEKAIEFLVENHHNCHLTFFGGEPTLCKDLIIFGIEYGNSLARKKRKYIAYSIVTNGTLLDDSFINILNENNVNIIYSFDGNEFSQNNYRPFASGQGSYNIVYNNLVKLINSRKDERYGHLVVRYTVTSETIGLMNSIYKELSKTGCKEISFSLVSAEREKEYAIKEDDLNNLRDTYEKMINSYYNELLDGNSFNKFFESIVERIESNYISKTFCDCGRRYMAIDAEGDVYPCEGFIGIKELNMGNIINKEQENHWSQPQNVDENIKCKECWARYLCGRSCYHEAWMRTASVNGRDELVCETYKIAFEYALTLYLKLKEKNINLKDIIGEKLLPTKSIPTINWTNVKQIRQDKIYTSNGLENNFISLNETAQRVFELCDGINNILNISQIMTREYACEYDIYSDISNIINCFLDNEIMYLTI